jgi:hypothetical protein
MHNYDQPIEVIGEPYDYGLAGSAYVNIDDERVPKVNTPAVEAAAAD